MHTNRKDDKQADKKKKKQGHTVHTDRDTEPPDKRIGRTDKADIQTYF